MTPSSVLFFLKSVIVCGALCVMVTVVFFVTHSPNPAQLAQSLDTCITSDGRNGYCMGLKSCSIQPQQSELINNCTTRRSRQPVICCPINATELTDKTTSLPTRTVQATNTSEVSIVPLTHSPNINATTAYRIAQMKCEEYGKTVVVIIQSPTLALFSSGGPPKTERIDTCAMVEQLIVGGQNAKPKEFPHMALIGYGGEENIEWQCGGSLISTRFVLSAAHCSRPINKGPAQWVKLGELDTSSDMDDANPELFRIEERIVHPRYEKPHLYHDIALFKLEKKVDVSGYIRPLCLFTKDSVPSTQAIATGWGRTSWAEKGANDVRSNKNQRTVFKEKEQDEAATESEADLISPLDIRIGDNPQPTNTKRGSPSESLMKVRLNMVSTEKCDEAYVQSRGKKLPRGVDGETMICAGDEAGKDTCQGDSGGPLQIPLTEPYCMYSLVGVTSFGKFCGQGVPGVYTKVQHYLPWIVQNAWPEELD